MMIAAHNPRSPNEATLWDRKGMCMGLCSSSSIGVAGCTDRNSQREVDDIRWIDRIPRIPAGMGPVMLLTSGYSDRKSGESNSAGDAHALGSRPLPRAQIEGSEKVSPTGPACQWITTGLTRVSAVRSREGTLFRAPASLAVIRTWHNARRGTHAELPWRARDFKG